MREASFIICEETGQLPVDGVCPVHGGDACLSRYEHYRSVGMDVTERVTGLLTSCGKPNWDSYGAEPVDVRAVNAVQRFLNNTHVGPTKTGGLCIEWAAAGVECSIDWSAAGELVGLWWERVDP